MIYKFFYVVLCFLIFSCDLSNEEDRDCNGDQSGTAFVDDCGYCAGGNTNITPDSDKDCCGECFGLHTDCTIACEECGDNSENIINYDSCTSSLDSNQSCDNLDQINSCVNTKGCEWNFDTSNCIDCNAIFSINNDLCVDDLCDDYLPQNNDIFCESIESDDVFSYSYGSKIRCELDDEIGNICFPADCNNDFSFNDLYGKVTWIEISATW